MKLMQRITIAPEQGVEELPDPERDDVRACLLPARRCFDLPTPLAT